MSTPRTPSGGQLRRRCPDRQGGAEASQDAGSGSARIRIGGRTLSGVRQIPERTPQSAVVVLNGIESASLAGVVRRIQLGGVGRALPASQGRVEYPFMPAAEDALDALPINCVALGTRWYV